jgi:hypothetical protein
MEKSQKVELLKKSLFIHIKGKESEEYINTEHITNFSGGGYMLFIDITDRHQLSFTFDTEEEAKNNLNYVISAVNIHS